MIGFFLLHLPLITSETRNLYQQNVVRGDMIIAVSLILLVVLHISQTINTKVIKSYAQHVPNLLLLGFRLLYLDTWVGGPRRVIK